MTPQEWEEVQAQRRAVSRQNVVALMAAEIMAGLPRRKRTMRQYAEIQVLAREMAADWLDSTLLDIAERESEILGRAER